MNWFYESAGQQQGPVNDADLDQLIAEGKVTPATLVWREGQANWMPLGDARPSGGAAPLPGAPAVPGLVRCDACGSSVPPSGVIQIGNRSICASCKPAVLQQIQQGTAVTEYGGVRTGPDWEHRDQLGIVKAAWGTIKAVLTLPSETFTNMKREGGLGSPLFFNMLVGGFGSAMAMLYQAGVRFATGPVSYNISQAGKTQLPFSPELFTSGYTYLVLALLMPFFVALGSLIGAGILHLSLMICSGAKQPFETTFRAYSYSAGAANILQAIPLCGGFAAAIWGLVATCIGLARAHEINTGRAVFAVFLPTIVCCTIGALVGVGVMGIAAAAAKGAHASVLLF